LYSPNRKTYSDSQGKKAQPGEKLFYGKRTFQSETKVGYASQDCVIGNLRMTCQDLDPQDKGKVEEVLKLSFLAVTFDHKEEEWNITGCIHHIKLLEMADKKTAVHQDQSREEGAYPLHLQGAGIEVGKHTC
jgi:hypothetical protein